MTSTSTLSGEFIRQIQASSEKIKLAKSEMDKVIVGQEGMVDALLIALLCNGHVLIEGLPGLAKTLAVTTLAQVIDCEFKRIQFTPDLLPADLIGTSVYNPKEGTFSIHKGPIFTHVLLADEINRAPAKVQSALLESMQEGQVTISGTSFPLAMPYFVLATQNPIEHEGTYPLAEAQTDRFMMKIKIDYPTLGEEKEILQRMGTLGPLPKAKAILSKEDILGARQVVSTIHIEDKVIDYILSIVGATRYPKKYGLDLEDKLLFGASPRASLALKMGAKAHAFLMGRPYATPDDVKQVAMGILRHRLRRTYESEAEGLSSDEIIETILLSLKVP